MAYSTKTWFLVEAGPLPVYGEKSRFELVSRWLCGCGWKLVKVEFKKRGWSGIRHRIVDLSDLGWRQKTPPVADKKIVKYIFLSIP